MAGDGKRKRGCAQQETDATNQHARALVVAIQPVSHIAAGHRTGQARQHNHRS